MRHWGECALFGVCEGRGWIFDSCCEVNSVSVTARWTVPTTKIVFSGIGWMGTIGGGKLDVPVLGFRGVSH